MTRFKTISSTSAMIAALSMAVTPVAAAELPAHAPQSPVSSAVPMDQNWEPEGEIAQRHRRHRYRHRRHRGVDAGDVVAGVLILGGIAAIASAASNNKRARRQGPYASPYRTNSNARTGGGQGIDNAVDMCLREINRNVRVEGVDNVSRSGEGWNVTGRLYNGDGFSCRIGNNGKISDVSFGGQTAGYTPAQTQDRQYSNDRYAAAWDREEGRTVQATAQPTGPQPAYPGGPLPGDEGYEDGRLGG